MTTKTTIWITAAIDIVWSIIFGLSFFFLLKTDFESYGIEDWGIALMTLAGLAFLSFFTRLAVNLKRIEKINEMFEN